MPTEQAVANPASQRQNNIEENNRTFNFLGIACGLAFYFLLGIEETITSPYFSLQASKRGLTTLEIGLSFCIMEVSNFVFSFVIMFTIRPGKEKLYCTSGMFILGVSSCATASLQWIHERSTFFTVSIFLEILVGVGNAMALATLIPIITSLSLENAGTITSLVEAFLSLGGLVGPPAGSLLYKYFGMFLPPLVAGLLVVFCGLMSTVFLANPPHMSFSKNTAACLTSRQHHRSQNHVETKKRSHLSSISSVESEASIKSDSSNENHCQLEEPASTNSSSFDPWAYIKFIIKPNLVLISMLGIIVAGQMVFFDVCLPLYLDRVFKLDEIQIGLMFLTFSLSNVGMVPLYGVAIDRGYGMHITLLTAFGFSVVFGVLYLPEVFPQLQTIWFISVSFVMAGCFSAGAFVPSYLIYEKIAQYYSFENLKQTKLMVATWCNNLFAIGAFAGSTVLAGPVFENFGFNYSCLVISVTTLVFLIGSIFVAFKMNMMTKMYYVEDDDEDSANASSVEAANEAEAVDLIQKERLSTTKVDFSLDCQSNMSSKSSPGDNDALLEDQFYSLRPVAV